MLYSQGCNFDDLRTSAAHLSNKYQLRFEEKRRLLSLERRQRSDLEKEAPAKRSTRFVGFIELEVWAIVQLKPGLDRVWEFGLGFGVWRNLPEHLDRDLRGLPYYEDRVGALKWQKRWSLGPSAQQGQGPRIDAGSLRGGLASMGRQYRPQHTIMAIMETPTRQLLISGSHHAVSWVNKCALQMKA